MEAMLHPHSAASPSAALAGRDAKFEGRAASTAPACSACGRTTAKFSKTQAKQKSMRRCIECVDNGVQGSGGGLATKPAAPSAQVGEPVRGAHHSRKGEPNVHHSPPPLLPPSPFQNNSTRLTMPAPQCSRMKSGT